LIPDGIKNLEINSMISHHKPLIRLMQWTWLWSLWERGMAGGSYTHISWYHEQK